MKKSGDYIGKKAVIAVQAVVDGKGK